MTGSRTAFDSGEVLEALSRIKRSKAFGNSQKLVPLLEFVVHASLRGEANSLKETTIGVGLYNRDPGYDPKQDSIVRTHASRLRDRLEEYYRTEGHQDPVAIHLVRGSYAPVFARQDSSAPAGNGTTIVEQPRPSPRAGTRRKRWVVTAAAALAASALGILVWSGARSFPKVASYTQLTRDGRPKWLVGTDGVRIYHGTGNFTAPGLAQVSVSGGDSVPIQLKMPGLRPLGLSPLGDKVLLSDYYPGNLWSHDLISGYEQRLGEAVGPEAAWSPDGKSLAFIRDNDLWIASANGTKVRKLATISGRGMHGLRWSPDGTKLRFTLWERSPTTPSIWEVSSEGKNPHPLLPGWHTPPNEDAGAWTADGRYFIFQSQGQLWALAEDNPSFFGHRSQPVQITNSPIPLSSPLPALDGKRIFAVGRTARGVLMWHDGNLSQWLPYLSGISAEYAAFSPDGKWVAYTTYPGGSLWRSRTDGTSPLKLSDPPLLVGELRWSPDGKRIICSGRATNASPARIYLFSRDGGPPEVVDPEASDSISAPSWFPEGRKIAFLSDRDRKPYEIQVMDLATRQRSVIPGSQDMYGPVVSPDGKRMLAIRRHPITLMVYEFETRKWSELARVTGGFHNWSRDGKFAYFLQFPRYPAVLRIRLSDGDIETVADLTDVPMTGYQGCWLGLTPDDMPLILRDVGTQDIYGLELEK